MTSITPTHRSRPGPPAGAPAQPSVEPRHRSGRRRSTPLLDDLRGDEGAATAEYAIVIMAAVSFAGLLVTILRSAEVRGVLTDLVRQALSVG